MVEKNGSKRKPFEKKEHFSVTGVLRGRVVIGGVSNMGSKKKKKWEGVKSDPPDSATDGSGSTTPISKQVSPEGADKINDEPLTIPASKEDKSSGSQGGERNDEVLVKDVNDTSNMQNNFPGSNDTVDSVYDKYRNYFGKNKEEIDISVESGSQSKDESSATSFSVLKGFTEEDIRSPSIDKTSNLQENFLAQPGETMDDYMVRWMNRNKNVENVSGFSSKPQEPKQKGKVGDETKEEEKKRKVNFRLLETNLDNKKDGIDIVFPSEVVQQSSKRFVNTLFGYFLGNRLPFPVVDRHVCNVWKKYGLEKTMMNSSGFFYF